MPTDSAPVGFGQGVRNAFGQPGPTPTATTPVAPNAPSPAVVSKDDIETTGKTSVEQLLATIPGFLGVLGSRLVTGARSHFGVRQGVPGLQHVLNKVLDVFSRDRLAVNLGVQRRHGPGE